MFSVDEIIIVEGKYDKMRLSSVVDALVVTTDGFRVYNNKEKQKQFQHLAAKRGVIILTDSDSAGLRIRNYLCRCLDGVKVKHAYIPEVHGKEKRKSTPGAQQLLGVEGMSNEVIINALKKAKATPKNANAPITAARLYCDGLIGKPNSAQKRHTLLKTLNMPESLSSKAMLDVINRLLTQDEYNRLMAEIVLKN
ncbi:MAG: DUF4093 domain-containing protein [Firmicutes bacterium]|nr:DUF4093 domain-containing protein [Bacillota bacterium]